MPSFKQDLQVVPQAKRNAVLLSGGAGQRSLGAGQVNATQMAKPTYNQYIPSPTDHGVKIGAMAGQLADTINTTALSIAKADAENEATIHSATGQKLLTKEMTEGILAAQGKDALDGRPIAKARMEQFIVETSGQMEGQAKASYISKMQVFARTMGQRIDSHYLVERPKVEKMAWEAQISAEDNMAYLAVASPDKAVAFLGQAYMTRALTRGQLTAKDLQAGRVDNVAQNETVLEFAKSILDNGDHNDLEPYIAMMMGSLDTGGEAELQALLQADTKTALAEAQTQRKLTEEQVMVTYTKDASLIGQVMKDAVASGTLAAAAQKLRLSYVGTRYEEYYIDRIDALEGSLATPVTKAEPDWEVTAFLQRNAASGTPPGLLALNASRLGLVLTNSDMNKYIPAYESKIGPRVNDIYGNLEGQIGGFVEDAKNLTNGEVGYFLTTPEGEAYINMMLVDSRDRLETAYREAKSGTSGRIAARNEADAIKKEIQSGQWNPAMVTLAQELLDTVPTAHSVFKRFAPKGDTGIGTFKGTINPATVPETTVKYIHSLTPAQVNAIPNVGLRGDLHNITNWNAYFDAKALKLPSRDPAIAALKFQRSLAINVVRADEKLDLRAKARIITSITGQFDYIFGQYSPEMPEAAKEPDDQGRSGVTGEGSNMTKLINSGKQIMGI